MNAVVREAGEQKKHQEGKETKRKEGERQAKQKGVEEEKAYLSTAGRSNDQLSVARHDESPVSESVVVVVVVLVDL
jgi:hypothetical protein